MKILAINGSPNRKGTTSSLIDILLDECASVDVVSDKVHLEDYFILPYEECFDRESRRVGANEDDFFHLKARMLDADGIIVGSPYYSGEPSEHLQLFFERMSQNTFFEDEFYGKCFVGVCTSAVAEGNDVAVYCAGLGQEINDYESQVSGVLCEAVVYDEGVKDIYTDEAVKAKARAVATKFIKDIRKKSELLVKMI